MKGIFGRIVERPRSFAARGWIFQIHLYTGLLVGLYVLVMGLSGSALVFYPQVRSWEDQSLLRASGSGQRLSADQILEAVRAAHPGIHIMTLWPPAEGRETFLASTGRMGAGHEIYVDPYTARIVGEQDSRKDVWTWLQQLHFNLLSGPTGRVVNGIGALLLFFLAVTGVVIWWPGKANWTRALTINRRAGGARIIYDLHSAVGFFAVIFIILISLTGAYEALPKQGQAFVSWFSHPRFKAAAPRLAVHGDREGVPVSELIDAATRAVPGTWVSSLTLPQEKGQAVRVVLMTGKPREYQDTSSVYLNPYTGDILRIDSVQGRSAGDSVIAWIPPLHFGSFYGGVALSILWSLLALCPALQGFSGALMWWNRVVKKKLRRRRSTEAQQDAAGFRSTAARDGGHIDAVHLLEEEFQ